MIWEKPVTNPEEARGRVLAGKCLCGAVHYTVADEFAYAANCHCSNCRRTTGSAFKPFAGIARDRLRLSKGEDKLMIFGDADSHDAPSPTACRNTKGMWCPTKASVRLAPSCPAPPAMRRRARYFRASA